MRKGRKKSIEELWNKLPEKFRNWMTLDHYRLLRKYSQAYWRRWRKRWVGPRSRLPEDELNQMVWRRRRHEVTTGRFYGFIRKKKPKRHLTPSEKKRKKLVASRKRDGSARMYISKSDSVLLP